MNLEKDILSELLTESSIDSMIAIGKDDSIIAWNKAASFLFQKEKKDVFGRNLQDILPSIKKDHDLIKAIGRGKENKQSFLPASNQFEHRRQVETHIIPLQSGKEIIGVMLLKHDVSHRIKKEEELQVLNTELQKRLRQLKITSRELAHLTDIATHNLKEPIRIVYTAIEWLIKTEAKSFSDAGKASVRRIQSSLNRMNLLLDDVIMLTQISIIDPPETVLNLEEVWRDVLNQLEQRIQETETKVTTGETCELRANKKQLHLLLQHILNNIIRFNETGQPKVKMECCLVDYENSDGMNGMSGRYYQLSIIHNGSGFENFDPSSSVDIFEKSETNHAAVATIIAAKVMEAHSGFLKIEKKDDKTTVINCYYPI